MLGQKMVEALNGQMGNELAARVFTPPTANASQAPA